MPTTTPQAALLSEASKLAEELDHEASKRACNVAMMPASLPVDAAKELRRLDARVAELESTRSALVNATTAKGQLLTMVEAECDRLRAQLQAATVKQSLTVEPVQAGELPVEREAFEAWRKTMQDGYNEWDAWKARAALSARKPLTDEQRLQVFRDAESRMVHTINLSWRNAVVDEVERAHGIGLEVKP